MAIANTGPDGGVNNNSSNNFLRRSTSFIRTGDWTIACWAQAHDTVENDFFNIGDETFVNPYIDTFYQTYLAGGIGLVVQGADGVGHTPTSNVIPMTAGNWYYIALIYNSTAKTLTLYSSAVGSNTFTSVSISFDTSLGSWTVNHETLIGFGNLTSDQNYRVWQTQLNTTQLLAEKTSPFPIAVSNIVADNPLYGVTWLKDTVDSHDFTIFGSVKTVQGPVLAGSNIIQAVTQRENNGPQEPNTRAIGPWRLDVDDRFSSHGVALSQLPAPLAGKIQNFKVRLDKDPTPSSWTFTWYVNGNPSALTLTINPGQTEAEVAGPLNINPGDLLSIVFDCHDITNNYSWCWEFAGNTPDSSFYGGTAHTPQWGAFSTGTGDGTGSIAGCTGAITGLRGNLDAAPTVGAVTFYVQKNGVNQDGTGGTVDTRLNITGSNTSGANSFSLPVDPEDTFYVIATSSGGATFDHPSYGMIFQAAQPGHFQTCGFRRNSVPSNPIYAWHSNSNASEILGESIIPKNGLVLTGMIVSGVADKNYRLRKDEADPPNQPTVTIPHTGTTFARDLDPTHSVAFFSSDTVDIISNQGSPNNFYWGFDSFVAGTGGVVVLKQKIFAPTGDHTPFEFTTKGGLALNYFYLYGGDSQIFVQVSTAGKYGVFEVIPLGWTTQYYIDPFYGTYDNFSVYAGYFTYLYVYNYYLGPFSGIYKITPFKPNDTVFTGIGLYGSNIQVAIVPIPNPFFVL